MTLFQNIGHRETKYTTANSAHTCTTYLMDFPLNSISENENEDKALHLLDK